MIKFEDIKNKKSYVAVVGLGYVGLPLAVALGKHFNVLGVDISEKRVGELRDGYDRTAEVLEKDFHNFVEFSSNPEDLKKAGIIIIAVPTPIDAARNPDLRPVVGASTMVGKHMSEGTIVVYESTVYPGLTEDICIPILAEQSGLEYHKQFGVGYSPERINPGDREHTLQTIVKVVSGSSEDVAEILDKLYSTVVTAGTHRASCIKVAEAAKVIENTQRDLNIALMNELSMIFDRLGIDTLDVLEAAGTKWNFLPFRPGLVGGHCIGVDPYYLTTKAEAIGHHPQVILAGRKINDSVGKFIADTTVKQMIDGDSKVKNAKVGILGLTFKENVPDLRNTKVVDVVDELLSFGVKVLVHDPYADPNEAIEEYGLKTVPFSEFKDLDALILAVSHKEYRSLSFDEIKSWFREPENALIIDVKCFFDRDELAKAGIRSWRL
ncbi:nucleotide sugar dehydrogenase [Desulfovibrio gilichinskyi]|uniref:UDP-N-acetyl-D-galactosamine dehydrogenase n=1 Tax=Desulfovibrio gilichinskyi TaxID=1519643 RepID=A0A1X7CSW5_9BACT|nr:nucleotide sugar dehydrogenase [Desulfovibrio gilichinskyi]SMF01931.1 UDP-N-acetyl-D-galactosamine dehydrogenase [Desulfovibrio gilichinskyi]